MFNLKIISGNRALCQCIHTAFYSWRERIFTVAYFLLILTISIPFLVNGYQAFLHAKWQLMLVYTISYALIAGLFFYGTIPFRVRVWSGVLVFFLSGLLPHLSDQPWYEGIRIFSAFNATFIVALAVLTTAVKSLISRPAGNQSLAEKPAEIDRVEAIKYLSRGVAHDLNSLLSGIATYPDVLLMDNTLDKATRKGLMIIRDAGQKAVEMVSDFLTILTGINEERQAVDLNHVIDGFFETPEFKILKTDFPKISIDIQLEPELIFIKAFDVHMEKAVKYLLGFACSHLKTAEPGHVKIITSNTSFPETTGGEKPIPPGEYVSLRMFVQGAGMAAEHTAHLFEPFYIKKVMGKEGTGLEMAVVWNIILDHDGFIHVTTDHSALCFDLVFPALQMPVDSGIFSIDGIRENNV